MVLVGTAVLVAIAELGDKTQLLTLALAARHGASRVLLAVGAAIVLLQGMATVAGGALGTLVPRAFVSWVAACLFVAFGVWTIATAGREEPAEAVRGRRVGPAISAFAAFLVAELGDKTQLMTAAIAAEPSIAAVPARILGAGGATAGSGIGTLASVWVGSALGMFAVNAVAALIGSAVGSRLPRAIVARVAGAALILFGVAALWAAWRG